MLFGCGGGHAPIIRSVFIIARTMTGQSTQERFKRGAADAGRFFDYIASFVGFSADDATAIRETRFIIEKYIPTIVGGFYTQLLKFPATRRLFEKKDGTLDQAYLEMRMQHQAGFWRRAASGQFDEDFARFTDYVGRAHTSHGADPNVYIAQRYVIGMVGFVQRGVTEALGKELREVDPDLERRAIKAWNALMMVVLEMFSRPYVQEGEPTQVTARASVDDAQMMQLAVETYERELGMARAITRKAVRIARADEIADGERKIVDVDGVSVGVFHHQGKWIALHNSCLHRGGPVCAGPLEGDTLTCPWHGYQYDVMTGRLLLDPSARLDTYVVDVRDGQVFVTVPTLVRDEPAINLNAGDHEKDKEARPMTQQAPLKDNEFQLSELQPGQARCVSLNGKAVAVYNVEGKFYATDDTCTHAGGPLSEGRLEGMNIICPWHDSCFDVSTGAVTCKPARKPVQTYRVVIRNGIGSIEP
jgi:nitrite reductase/ring-hydroxylating ferredoxin subunit